MAQRSRGNDTETTTTKTREEIDGVQETDTSENTPTLQLRLEQTRDERRVVFHEGVVDNEHMNRMKSKCCCIYKKPLAFGESSSEDDDECEHCFGHPERRKKNKKSSNSALSRDAEEPSTSTEAQTEPSQAPPAASDMELPVSAPDFEATVKPSL
ncbi:E3 ubiquitin-protein ligase PPP1R11 [Drosophila innubila]|uniref:E3 ubiquitin-protein ligase PPP1R11 n=1 Tax=Drosophila innubila TaxID=198719 RepID=UPI00148DE639|nr:E3 ubiquitin-protein ligase PPP1R11 [Drosophila innubila]